MILYPQCIIYFRLILVNRHKNVLGDFIWFTTRYILTICINWDKFEYFHGGERGALDWKDLWVEKDERKGLKTYFVPPQDLVAPSFEDILRTKEAISDNLKNTKASPPPIIPELKTKQLKKLNKITILILRILDSV